MATEAASVPVESQTASEAREDVREEGLLEQLEDISQLHFAEDGFERDYKTFRTAP